MTLHLTSCEPVASDNWQPVSTAPLDGTEVKLLVEVTAHWVKDKIPMLLIDAGWKLDLIEAKARWWQPLS